MLIAGEVYLPCENTNGDKVTDAVAEAHDRGIIDRCMSGK